MINDDWIKISQSIKYDKSNSGSGMWSIIFGYYTWSTTSLKFLQVLLANETGDQSDSSTTRVLN